MKSLLPKELFEVAAEQGQTTSAFDSLAAILDITTPMGKEFLRQSLENCKLMENKNLDYGTRNISEYGTFGVVIRMSDKFKRINNLFNRGQRRKRAVNESILDTFQDISNYATIAILVETGKWPTE